MEYKLDDNTLLKIALITSFLGLIILFLIMYFSNVPEMNIKDVNESTIGKKIILNGDIEKITKTKDNKTTFIKISQKCSIDAVSFGEVNILENSTISVEGKVQEYNKKISFIIDKIILVK